MWAVLLRGLADLDRFLLEESQALRWGPLTSFFIVASAWWVKGLVFVAVGAVGDAVSRRLLPRTAAAAGLAFILAAGASTLVKDVIDRARPSLADPGVTALVATPDSPSFPSGHTCTAFAAAAAVGALCPRLRWPLFGLAALVGLSRIYLGVHYWLDVLAGAALGTAIGSAVVWGARRATGLRQRLA